MQDDLRALIVEQIPGLRRYARALLRDTDAADDLVQDCLLRAMDRLHLWRTGSSMRAWLFAILHNQHVNTARRRAGRPDRVALDPENEEASTALPDQGGGLAIRDMERALAALPDELRQTVLVIGLEGMSYAEAAEILDVPVGTVMSRLSRGRQRLRDLMDGPADEPRLRRVK